MPILSRHGVYVEIAGASGGVGGNGGSGGGSDMASHAHGISDPGHSHGLEEFTRVMVHADNLEAFVRVMEQAIAQSTTMPPQVWEPCAKYLPCPNAFVVRDIDQRFSWQTD